MFDDDAGRPGKLLYAVPGGVGVGDIVERQFLAPVLNCAGETASGDNRLAVKSRALVRVFAIA